MSKTLDLSMILEAFIRSGINFVKETEEGH